MDQYKWEKYNKVSADPPWPQNSRSVIGKDGKPTRFGGGAQEHYNVDILTQKDIENLPVQEIADKNCVLFLWATFPKLPEALDTLRAWGFRYSTVAFVWVKLNRKNDKLGGLLQALADTLINRRNPTSILMKLFSAAVLFSIGCYTKSNCEICLLGTKGKVGKLRRDTEKNPIFFDPKERISVQSNYISQLIFSPVEKHSKKPEIIRKKMIELFGDIPRIELFARPYPSCEGWDLMGNEISGRDIRDDLSDKIKDIKGEIHNESQSKN